MDTISKMQQEVFSNGVKMPSLIISTNWMDYPTMKSVVSAGLKIGYRAFDTARDYGNEHIVGRVINECLAEQGLERKDIFITTKVGNSQQAKGNISEQIEQSLQNLQTDYIDCWQLHWPYPGYYIENYHKMEKVYFEGKAHAIGIANCHVRHLKALFNDGLEVAPHCVQFEHHPLRTATDIFEFCTSHQIVIQAYSPLCRMIDPIIQSPVLQNISQRTGKTISQVILRWHYQHHSVPCFKTVKTSRLAENYDIWDFSLSDEDMNRINSMNCDYKFHLESASCPGF